MKRLRLARHLAATGAALLCLTAVLFTSVRSEDKPKPREVATQPPRGYVCYRRSGPITVDGKLNDDAWGHSPWSDDFLDIEGRHRPKPRFRTRVKLVWDDEALYIAAELEEPHVRAVLTEHDSYIFHEDHDFEVFLDPDADSHLYAELEINARNTTWDLLLTKPYKDGGRPIDAWEIDGLMSAVNVDGTLNDPSDTDRGWTLEIRWPWKGLKQLATCPIPPRPGDQWRINFSRVQLPIGSVGGRYQRRRGAEENWVWSPQGVVDMHRPERWGYLQFSDATPGHDSLKPDPTADARAILHQIYERQQQHFRENRRYAATWEALGVDPPMHQSFRTTATLEATTRWFEAFIELKSGQTVRIHADARIIVEERR